MDEFSSKELGESHTELNIRKDKRVCRKISQRLFQREDEDNDSENSSDCQTESYTLPVRLLARRKHVSSLVIHPEVENVEDRLSFVKFDKLTGEDQPAVKGAEKCSNKAVECKQDQNMTVGTYISGNDYSPSVQRNSFSCQYCRNSCLFDDTVTEDSSCSPCCSLISHAEENYCISHQHCREFPVRKRFMEDGGHSITPAADGFFPRPQPGQTLKSFLSSNDFKTVAELDRENAHFSVSEALISAMEQMKYEKWIKEIALMQESDDSDEEIRELKAKIKQKQIEKKQKVAHSKGPDVLITEQQIQVSPDLHCQKSDSTTDFSMYESPKSTDHNSDSEALTDTECASSIDVSKSSSTPLGSSPMLSPCHLVSSAENVALNLLKHFKESHLPKASDLNWLVSEVDVPQKLLPLPNSIAISPVNANKDGSMGVVSNLRGTADWAPPRPQLVLTLHRCAKRSVILSSQNWKCAGCGLKVSIRLSRHFRYCNYLGRYFCTACHKNNTATIPARVLHNWDFKQQPVSEFSRELLETMKKDPLFPVDNFNPQLFKFCSKLRHIQIQCTHLCHMLPYINTCSHAVEEQALLSSIPSHWTADPSVFSMEDLVNIKNGSLTQNIKDIILKCFCHISNCLVCKGKGFICEICQSPYPIFPFQLETVSRCRQCYACYHRHCFNPASCPKCLRKFLRKSAEDILGTT